MSQHKLYVLRENLSALVEIRDIVLADVVLSVAVALTLSGGVVFASKSVSSVPGGILGLLSIAAIGVTLSFVLHELMHKFVAQRYGAIAGFRTSLTGLAITLITGAFGFLLGIPGATMIYAHSFGRRENGIVSLAGPLTNFVVFGASLAVLFALGPAQNSYLAYMLSFTVFISILLAFFNMLPIFPLDGSKVLAWNKPVYIGTMAVIFVLMLYFTQISLYTILFMFAIALFFSLFYRNIL